MLNIGMDMSEVLLPQLEVIAYYDKDVVDDNAQVNPSSIYSYLNIRGVGRSINGQNGDVMRNFNAVSYLGYWDVYKNYYANKQEERGFVVHSKEYDASFKIKKSQVSVINTSGS